MMEMFFDNNKQLTNNILGIMVAIILVLSLFSTVFSGMAAKTAFEGLQSDVSLGATTSGADVRFASGLTHPGARDAFFGRPEPPVFYQIGDTELVRSDRVHEKVDKPAGFEGMDPNRWRQDKSFATESFDPMKYQGFDPAKYM